MPLGPGLSLVLQTSRGFLQSGVGGTLGGALQTANKDISVNATKALSPSSLGLGRDQASGGRQHHNRLTVGQGRPPKLSSQGERSKDSYSSAGRGEQAWVPRAESWALLGLFRPLSHSSCGVWRSEVGGHAASLGFVSLSLFPAMFRWAVGEGVRDRPYM